MSKVFLDVLNLSFTAGWLIIAVILIRVILKRAPKRMRCLLWGLVALRLAVPFHIESALSLVPSADTIPADIEYAKVPQVDTGVPAINTVLNPVMEQSFSPAPAASANPLQILIPICAVVWLAGIGIMLLYALFSFVLLKRKVAASVLLQENIYVCDEVKSPFILGIVRPKIYLPSEIGQAGGTESSSMRDCVLQHERTHLRRGDHFWKPLGFAILCVYWFHPLCWIAYMLFCKDIEFACDEKATKDMDDSLRADYCQALLNCSSHGRKRIVCPVAFGEVGVKDRVKSILNYKKPAFWMILLSIAAAIVVVICFMTNPKSEDANPYIEDESETGGGETENNAAWDEFLNYHTPYTLNENVQDLKDIRYGKFLTQTGSEAEFYRATKYISAIPESNAFAVFDGVYDADHAESKLAQNSSILYVQGTLSDFVYLDSDTVPVEELAEHLKAVSLEYVDDSGTVDDLSADYVRISLDVVQNGLADTVLEVDVGDLKEEVAKDSSARLYWVDEETRYLSGYTGYVDEYEAFVFWTSYENLDLDSDGKTDRVYFENDEANICNIELQFGDGSVLRIENQDNGVVPIFYALPNEAGKTLIAYYGEYPGQVGEVVNFDMAFYEKEGNEFVLSKVPFTKNPYFENSFPQYMNVTVSRVDPENYVVGYSCEQLPDFYEEVQMSKENYEYADLPGLFESFGADVECPDTRFYTLQISKTDPYVIECHAHIIYHCADELMVRMKYVDDEWKVVDYYMVDRYTNERLQSESNSREND